MCEFCGFGVWCFDFLIKFLLESSISSWVWIVAEFLKLFVQITDPVINKYSVSILWSILLP
jgi:hypothetical protein